MRQRLDLARIWRRALRAMPDTIDGIALAPLLVTCPYTLDQLLSEAPLADPGD
jgi:hypothetical protein